MAKAPVEYVNVEVDGRPLRLPKDEYLLWSMRDAGIDVPHFCAHKWLVPFGGCRMCMVKIEIGGKMMPKLQISCAMKPSEGMRILTQHEEVLRARKEQLEFHLLNHPLECPVCDKGGECMLQDQTMQHGWAASRYIEQKKTRPDEMMNDYIRLNHKRCFHCKRCIHYCESVDGSHLLKFVERGAETYIESYPPAEAPRFSGNVIDMCPVGALTAQSYRFMGRPWEQELTPSIGSLDSVGANIWVCGRLGDVARIIPRDNAEIENGLIDDVTRFSWECIEDPRRPRRAIVREGEQPRTLTRREGEELAAGILKDICGEHGPDSVGLIAGSELNTEEYVVLRRFADEVLDSSMFHFGDELFGAAGPDDATLTALLTNAASVDTICNAATVVTLGADLFDEAPALGLRLDLEARHQRIKLINARSFKSDFDRYAEFASYGYGNLLRFVRAVTNALSGQGESYGEAREFAEQLQAVGDDCAILCGDEVWKSVNPAELIRAVAALREAVAKANPAAQAVYLNAVYPSVNTAGALLIDQLDRFTSKEKRQRSGAGSLAKVLQAAIDGRVKALVIFDSDLMLKYPDRALVAQALKKVPTVIYCGPFRSDTSQQAQIHLPLGTWMHREGSVVSLGWHVQKRLCAHIDTVSPSVIDVVNSICPEMGHEMLAPDPEVLDRLLQEQLAFWPKKAYSQLPGEGVQIKPQLTAGDSRVAAQNELPQELKGSTDAPFVLIPKRFVYNDRPEVRYSPVFDKVNKPFKAYMNPADMQQYNFAEGAEASFSSGAAEFSLPLEGARWVRRGSVVINDHYRKVPANALAAGALLKVQLKQKVQSGGGK